MTERLVLISVYWRYFLSHLVVRMQLLKPFGRHHLINSVVRHFSGPMSAVQGHRGPDGGPEPGSRAVGGPAPRLTEEVQTSPVLSL